MRQDFELLRPYEAGSVIEHGGKEFLAETMIEGTLRSGWRRWWYGRPAEQGPLRPRSMRSKKASRGFHKTKSKLEDHIREVNVHPHLGKVISNSTSVYS